MKSFQHWGVRQTTLHREVEERDRERELNRAPYNEKAAIKCQFCPHIETTQLIFTAN